MIFSQRSRKSAVKFALLCSIISLAVVTFRFPTYAQGNDSAFSVASAPEIEDLYEDSQDILDEFRTQRRACKEPYRSLQTALELSEPANTDHFSAELAKCYEQASTARSRLFPFVLAVVQFRNSENANQDKIETWNHRLSKLFKKVGSLNNSFPSDNQIEQALILAQNQSRPDTASFP